jgi:LAS superfamily LD-carboxypeptidase LdcB
VISVSKFQKYAVVAAGVIFLAIGIHSCQSRYEDPGIAQYSSPSIAEQITQLLPDQPATESVATETTPKPFTAPPMVAAIPTQTNLSSVITQPIQPTTTITAALTGKIPATSKQPEKSAKTKLFSSYRFAVAIDNSITKRHGNIARQSGYIEQYPEIAAAEMVEYRGQRLHKDAATAFDKMRQAAAKDRVTLQIISGFRGIKAQSEIFASKGGGLGAAEYSAPPGHSQHHTGLAIDLNSLSPNFNRTKEFAWLQKHGSTYGFMLPYANTNGDLGPSNEPWHWVYVGKPPAMELMANFLSRARQNNYDPLMGNNQLEKIYKAQTITADNKLSRQ